jgi:hypothetical protein
MTADELALTLSPQAYYVADVANVTVDGSTNVSQWDDLSGNARHATQATAGFRPFYDDGTGIGEWAPRIVSQDAARYLICPDLSGIGIVEIWAVVKIGADPGVSGRTCFLSLGAGGNDHYPFTDGVIYDGQGSTVRKTVGDATASLATVHLLRIFTKANDWSLRVNNQTVHSTATNTVGWAATPIIGDGTGNSAPWELRVLGFFPELSAGNSDDLRDAYYDEYSITP